MASTPMTLFYWPIKARGYPIMAMAKYAKLDITQKGDMDIDALKAEGKLAFGQLPYLEHGEHKVVQSGAIMRYIAKVGGLSGSNDAEFIKSEMLLCEAEDIYMMMMKANYANPKTWAEFFAADAFGKHAANLEKMILPNGFFCESRVAGAFYLAAVLDMAVSIEAGCLDGFPKLKAFYQSMMALDCFKEVAATTGNYISK